MDLSSLPVTDCISDVPVFPVPEHMRRPSSNDLTAVEGAFVKHVGLEELFPGTGLADLFDEDGAFRTELRRAARDDMFVPNPKFSDAANEQIKDLKASLMVGWRHSPTQFESLTRLFEARGLAPLDGPAFMGRIGALVSGSSVSGSLIDIVGITNKRIRHSWHQDNGLEGQITVMLGFPPEDRYEGPGVFRSALPPAQPSRLIIMAAITPSTHPRSAPRDMPDGCIPLSCSLRRWMAATWSSAATSRGSPGRRARSSSTRRS